MAQVPDIKSQDLGLKVLVRGPTDEDEVEADIIAVHGIGVDPMTTWTHSKTGINWLSHETMLPEELPRTRIMVFAYDSVWFGTKAVKQSLDSITQKLLRALEPMRETCPHRPIVFIGHCFGGLVLQQAYTMSHMYPKDFPNISSSTRGFIFLGTPHRGVDGNSALSTPGEIYTAIMAANIPTQDNVLHTMMQGNDLLQTTVDNFTSLIKEKAPAPRLFCFYEQRPTDAGQIISKKLTPAFIVSQSSASLPGHPSEGLALDHFRLNKFENNRDNHYRCVLIQLSKMVKAAQEVIQGDEKADQEPISNREIARLLRRHSGFATRMNILGTIEKYLRAKGRVVLCDEPGSGKTYVAVEYAHRFLTANPGSQVFWVNARSIEELRLSYEKIATALRISEKDMVLDRLLVLVNNTLARTSSCRWLLLLDGLDDIEILKPWVPGANTKGVLATILPECDEVETLVTTRNKVLADSIVKQRTKCILSVRVRDLDDASRILFRKVTSDPLKKSWIEQVTNLLGLSAGALHLTHIGFRISKMPLRAYLERLKSERSNSGLKGYPAWKLLYNILRSQSAEAGQWILTHGILDVQALPKELLSRRDKGKVIGLLNAHGMIEASADGSFYSVPAFIQHCTQLWLSETSEKVETETLALNKVSDKLKDDTARSLLPVLKAVSRFEQPTTADGKEAMEKVREWLAKLQDQPNHQVLTLNPHPERPDTTLVRPSRHDPVPEAVMLQYGQNLKELERSDPGWNKTETLRAASCLAALQTIRGRSNIEALDTSISLYKRIVESISRKPDNSAQLARHQYNLAHAYDMQKSCNNAVFWYHRALKNAAAVKPKDWELWLLIQNSLAESYAANSQLNEALKTLSHTLENQNGTLMPNHSQVLATQRVRAFVLQESGDLDAAEEQLNSVLHAQLSVFGGEHRETLRTESHIAQIIALRGETLRSEQMCSLVLEKQERELGRFDSDTTQTRKFLGELKEGKV